MASDTASGSGSGALYGDLRRRNRLVGVLRIAVPALGVAVVAALAIQFASAGLTPDFTVQRVAVERDRLLVEGPSYTGRMADGSVYLLTAEAASAALDRPSLIDLSGASATLTGTDGTVRTARAASATFDNDTQALDVPGVAEIGDNKGSSGTLANVHLDVGAQVLTTKGAVRLNFTGGQTLTAEGMRYYATSGIWHFDAVTFTLPRTPGEETP
jgi:hypothetical protein